jgi:ubiquinone/menaquinone biosynthesis C-methylase UbiE
MSRKRHWDDVYSTKRLEDVSWFQLRAALSCELIANALDDHTAAILDIGGGASPLAGDLLRAGYRNVAVLDLAASALSQARKRLGVDGATVRWIVGDVLDLPVRARSIGMWHDRAVFHFLTESQDRARYVAEVRRAVRPGGLVLVATFASRRQRAVLVRGARNISAAIPQHRRGRSLPSSARADAFQREEGGAPDGTLRVRPAART